jgi:hypothetical protein
LSIENFAQKNVQCPPKESCGQYLIERLNGNFADIGCLDTILSAVRITRQTRVFQLLSSGRSIPAARPALQECPEQKKY